MHAWSMRDVASDAPLSFGMQQKDGYRLVLLKLFDDITAKSASSIKRDMFDPIGLQSLNHNYGRAHKLGASLLGRGG